MTKKEMQSYLVIAVIVILVVVLIAKNGTGFLSVPINPFKTVKTVYHQLNILFSDGIWKNNSEAQPPSWGITDPSSGKKVAKVYDELHMKNTFTGTVMHWSASSIGTRAVVLNENGDTWLGTIWTKNDWSTSGDTISSGQDVCLWSYELNANTLNVPSSWEDSAGFSGGWTDNTNYRLVVEQVGWPNYAPVTVQLDFKDEPSETKQVIPSVLTWTFQYTPNWESIEVSFSQPENPTIDTQPPPDIQPSNPEVDFTRAEYPSHIVPTELNTPSTPPHHYNLNQLVQQRFDRDK
jgi:hypothetical protein